MFMLRLTLSTAIVGIIIGQCSCLAAGKDVSLEKIKHYKKYKDVLLNLSDVPKVIKKKNISLPWTRGIGSEGTPIDVDGFVQEFEVQDSPVKIILQYGRFTDTNTAQEAFDFHVKDVAIVFDAKPWTGLHLAKKADKILYAAGTTSSSILLRDQKTCVLISCLGGTLAERRKTAVVFANRIIGRLRSEKKDEKK